MELLAKITNHYRAFDEYAIVSQQGHVLWEHAQFPHCSSRAAWQAYQSVIDQIPAPDWATGAGQHPHWAGCANWLVFRDAVDKLYFYLRQKDVALSRATVSEPVLLRPAGERLLPFQRGRFHLSIYARLDFAREQSCVVEFAEGEELALACGALTVVSGFRRQRLRGTAWIVAFHINLPALARTEALATDALLEPNVYDAVVFAAATAQPLDLPLPPPDILTDKLGWLNARFRKQYRHQDCPAVRRFLINGEDPRSATIEEVQRIRNHGLAPATEGAGDLLRSLPALNEQQCALLRQFADDHMTAVTADSVDDYPEYQVNLSIPILSELIGSDTVERLLRLPERIGAPNSAAIDELYCSIDCILRIYSIDTRPYIAFHSDICHYTVNISLSSEGDFQGGDLLAVVGENLQLIPKKAGLATIHSSQIVHGVSRITSGLRYSLILFFTARATPQG